MNHSVSGSHDPAGYAKARVVDVREAGQRSAGHPLETAKDHPGDIGRTAAGQRRTDVPVAAIVETQDDGRSPCWPTEAVRAGATCSSREATAINRPSA